jgi:hypothetical protein
VLQAHHGGQPGDCQDPQVPAEPPAPATTNGKLFLCVSCVSASALLGFAGGRRDACLPWRVVAPGLAFTARAAWSQIVDIIHPNLPPVKKDTIRAELSKVCDACIHAPACL